MPAVDSEPASMLGLSPYDIMQMDSGPSRLPDPGPSHFQDDLDPFLPAQDSAQESTVLKRLRAMAARSQAFSYPQYGHFVSQESQGLTELSWHANRLVWRRASHVIRTFSFDETITAACWAWMGDEEPEQIFSSPSSSPSPALGKQPQKPTPNPSLDDTQSSFAQPQLAFRSHLSGSSSSPQRLQTQSITSSKRQRALVVALHTTLYILYPSLGHEFTLLKDFKLRTLIPAPSFGILLQRCPEPDDTRIAQSGFEQPLPTLLFLGSPLDELLPVPIVHSISHRHQHRITLGPFRRHFSSIDEVLIPISCDHLPVRHNASNILLSYDPSSGRIRIYGSGIARQDSLPPTNTAATQQSDFPMSLGQEDRRPDQAGNLNYTSGPLSDTQHPNRPRESAPSARPSLVPRRSARLSGYGQRDAPSTTQKPSLRRRSSRFASTTDKNANMARIEESFSQPPGTSHPSSAPLPVTEGSQRLEDAAEAEEMGQIVEGLARRPPGAAMRADVATAAEQRLGAALDLGRSNAPNTRDQKRNLSMMRTPYAPASSGRTLSSTMHRRRSSRGTNRGDIDFDPTSFYNTTNVTGVSLLTAATADETRDPAAAAIGPQGALFGEAQHPAPGQAPPFNLANAPTAVLELLDTIETGVLAEPGSVGAFLLSNDPVEDSVVLFIVLPGSLVARVIRLETESPRHGYLSSHPADVESGRSQAPSRGAAPIPMAGISHAGILTLTDAGVLLLKTSDGHTFPPLDLDGDGRLTVRPDHPDATSRSRLQLLRPGRRGKNSFSVLTSKGKEAHFSVDLQPQDAVISSILTALSVVWRHRNSSDPKAVIRSWSLRRIEQPNESEWTALAKLLSAGQTPRPAESTTTSAWEKVLASQQRTMSEPSESLHALHLNADSVEATLLTLNAIAEDLQLSSNSDAAHRVNRIIDHVAQEHRVASYGILHLVFSKVDVSAGFTQPKHLRTSLLAVLRDVLIGRVKDEHQAVDMLLPALGLSAERASLSLGRTLSVIRMLLPNTVGSSCNVDYDGSELTAECKKASAIVRELARSEFGKTRVEDLPEPIALLVKRALEICRANPPRNLSSRELQLIGREDLTRQSEGRATVPRLRFSRSALRSLPKGAALDAMSAMLFPQDQRLQDVADMLLTARPTVVRAPHKPDRTDEENHREGVARLQNVAEKIKATAIGRGMFLMLTKKFDPTQRWHTPRLNLKILLRPPQSYQFPEPRHDSPELNWPEFHNGVASALEMVKTQGKLNSIWYFSQGAGGRTPRHAGLLLGLGLAGRFEEIGQVHAFRYLIDRHDLTSIGLLLGLACTFVGQGDQGVRSLLACHVKAFLPAGSANLAHSTLVQCAGLLGTGLLFLGSDVSHMTESLVDQIGQQHIETTNLQTFSREAYSLCAGLGAGLVMLGRGRRRGMHTERDKTLLRKLEVLIEGPPEGLFEETDSNPEWRVDLRITTAPASLAYGLIFLKSNNRAAAARLPLPRNMGEVDRIRPHILLMAAIARNLILWDDVQPSEEWVDSTLPTFLRGDEATKSHSKTDISAALARDHICAGAYFVMSLKFAGSCNAEAKSILLKRYKAFDEMSKSQSKHDYDGRIFQASARAIADQLALCLATVMAGSGDLDVLKVLRIAHGQRPGHDPYGSHMAIHMAIGLLFLGGGRYTLGTSDASVAALLIAFYPRFPTRANDNRAHLQAFRHLWFLAVEPRLVVAQDVSSGEVVYAPVQCRGPTADATRKTTLPSRVADLHLIERLYVDSDRYWASSLDLRSRRRDDTASTGLTVYVKLKAGYCSYLEDPDGYKSQFSQIARRSRQGLGDKAANVLLLESSGAAAAAAAAATAGTVTKTSRQNAADADDLYAFINALPQTIDSLLATARHTPWRVRNLMWLPCFVRLRGPLSFEEALQNQVTQWRTRLRSEAARELERNEALRNAIVDTLCGRPSSTSAVDSEMASKVYTVITILIPPELDVWDVCEVGKRMRGLLVQFEAAASQHQQQSDPAVGEAVLRVARTCIRTMLGHDEDEVDEALLRIMLM